MRRMEKKNVLLEVKDLRTYFVSKHETVKAVDGVSFMIREGETFGLVGESACGKSQTCRSILGLLKPPGRVVGGEILYKGRDIVKMNSAELRKIRGKEISVIFQEPMTSLNPVYTVGWQISEMILRHKKMSKKEAKAKAVEMLRLVNIPAPEKRVDEYPHELSGGMRQRVMIAMALACRPQILIADEPTTALDVTIQAQILDLIRELNESMGTSVVFITHDLGVISELCDTVLVMYTGHIVEKAPVSELFAAPKHPYTQGLMDAIPRITKDRPPLKTIEGMVPNPTERVEGCSFWPRCPYATEQCKKEQPPMFEISKERKVRCWRYQDAQEEEV